MPVPPTTTVPFNLGHLMRAHHVTLRQLKARTGFTLKYLRKVRAQERVSYTTFCDLHEAVTGEVVFSRARYEAICKQFPTAVWERENRQAD